LISQRDALAKARAHLQQDDLIRLEARCLDDGAPALVLGALNPSQLLTRRPRNLKTERVDPRPDLGVAQGIDDRCSQALGYIRGRACGGPDREP